MNKFIILFIILILSGCYSDQYQYIHIPDPAFLKRLSNDCDKPETVDFVIQLTEHYKYKCTDGFWEGADRCYGWITILRRSCVIKGTKTYSSFSYGFGNSDLSKYGSGTFDDPMLLP